MTGTEDEPDEIDLKKLPLKGIRVYFEEELTGRVLISDATLREQDISARLYDVILVLWSRIPEMEKYRFMLCFCDGRTTNRDKRLLVTPEALMLYVAQNAAAVEEATRRVLDARAAEMVEREDAPA